MFTSNTVYKLCDINKIFYIFSNNVMYNYESDCISTKKFLYKFKSFILLIFIMNKSKIYK